MGMMSSVRRVAVAIVAVLASLALLTPHAVAVPATTTYNLRIVNNTGVDPTHVFVTLTPGEGPTPTLPSKGAHGMAFNVAYPLEASGGKETFWQQAGGSAPPNSYELQLSGAWSSGTILYSLGDSARSEFTGYTGQPTVGLNEHPYDFSEITFDANDTFNGDISAVNQIGIPARLSILKPNGTLANQNGEAVPATEYVGCAYATNKVLSSALSGWDSATNGVWRTDSAGKFLQLEGLGSSAIYGHYPSFEQYVKSMVGKTLTVRGYFNGNNKIPGDKPAYYNYSGGVATDGSIFLKGSLSDDADGSGTTQYPTTSGIFVPGEEIYDHKPSTWLAGTGFGVYAQNGPYTVAADNAATLSAGSWTGSATTPPASANDFISDTDQGWVPGTRGTYKDVGNDIYGQIYGDLVVSYAMGYWGSNATGSALYDSASWNTNSPPGPNASDSPKSTWWTPGGLPAYGAAWVGAVPSYARFNIYQYATQATGTSYGMSLGDRFAPTGTRNPSMAVKNTPEVGHNNYGTWQIELLATTGCATPTTLSHTSGPAGGGQHLTITGRNIYAGAIVRFGGTPADHVNVTLDPVSGISTIEATTPAHTAGTVPVVVTNKYGDAATGVDSGTVPKRYDYIGGGGGKKSQTASCAKFPAHIAKKGTVKVLGKCSTNAHKPVTVKASATGKRSKKVAARGDSAPRMYKLFKRNGKTFVRTYGHKIRLTLRYHASSGLHYRAFNASKRYTL